MKELLKKYSFVGLIGILLLSAIFYFAYEDNADKIEGKVVDGNNIIFTIGDKDVTADEFYDVLYKTSGESVILTHLSQDLIDLGIEATDEMNEEASEYSKNQITQLKQSLGADYDEEMEKILASVGLKDSRELDGYFLVQIKAMKRQENAVEALYPEYKEEFKPRILKHILISVEQTEEQKEAGEPGTPSEEVLAKMKVVEDALANGTDFSDVAYEHSDDTGSAQSGGALGLYDKNSISGLVKPFADAAMLLNSGETSGWVASEFGQHLIYFESDDKEVIRTQYNDQLMNSIFTAYPEYLGNQLMEISKENGLKFTDSELEKSILDKINPKIEEEKEETTEDTTDQTTEDKENSEGEQE